MLIMKKLKILTCTDFSSYSLLAEKAAENIRIKCNGTVDLIHVSEFSVMWDWMPPDYIEGRFELDLLKKTISSGYKLTKKIRPLNFTLIKGIKGFEDGLIDMSEGEKKTVTIPSELAYGDYRGELISDVKLDMLPTDVKVGDELVGESDMGPIRVKVMEINEGMASLDANHPLAGKTLVFDLDVISVD
jgi:hypothetical protein